MKERSNGRRLFLGIIVVTLTLAAAGTLQAAPPHRAFSAAIVPTTATTNQTQSYTITITNVGSGGGGSANLGSATIQVPAGFTAVVVTENCTSSGGKTWTAALVGSEIQLCGTQGNDTFSGGEWVAVTFTATAPGSPDSCEWTTALHKNTNFHGPTPALSGTQPVVTVSGGSNGGGETAVSGAKFYDANVNGVWDAGEPGIEGWKVHLTGAAVDLYALTDSDGEFSFTGLAPGSYTVSEVFPLAPPIWLPTTETSFDATVTTGQNFVGPDFGNVCLGCNGGGHTLGFWSNKNGAAKFATLSGALSTLSGLHLVDGNGDPFNPASYGALRTWLLDGNAVNMAYMLSVQLAAMQLNVLAEFVESDALVYAPGVPGASTTGFITIGALIDAAEASLTADGYTPAGDANRSTQETIKDALDDANNNKNFVCPEPCLPIVYLLF